MADDDLKIDSSQVMKEIEAPVLPYEPRLPRDYSPKIGMIACGGISPFHLEAYKTAGYEVAALCDLIESKAKERQKAFYPDAAVYTDYRDLLARDDIDVVDVATHPDVRAPIEDDVLEAGKHVLSQKPFVLDLDVGQGLVDLAAEKGLKIAVNQNGRWAPHYSYIRHALAAGLIGDVSGVHMGVHWDHGWTAGTPFDDVPHMILYDFAIHWFDILTCFMGDRRPLGVYATEAKACNQINKADMLAQVMIAYENAQATLVFDSYTQYGALDETYVAGTEGSITSTGPDLSHQTVTLYTGDGYATPDLKGEWFKQGFLGTMSELLCAIEEDREPANSAQNNLRSLELCFAALASAEDKEPKVPGEVRRMPGT